MTFSARSLVLYAAALFALLLVESCAQAEPPDLIAPLPSNRLAEASAAQAQMIARLERRPTTKSIGVVHIDTKALRAKGVRVILPNARKLTVTTQSLDARGETDMTWTGTIAEPPGVVTLVIRGGNVTGTITEGPNLYKIEPIGGGMHALIEVDRSRLPPEHPPSFQEIERRGALPPQSLSDAAKLARPVVIDVLVAHTPAAAGAVGDIRATILLAMAEANQSYRNSAINIKLNLVDTVEFAYAEGSRSFETILADFVGDAGINKRRDGSGADIAVLIIDKADYCGLADAILADSSTAFALVHFDCATGYYSFAHEIGHLQGARHDEATDDTAAPFAYGHGFRHMGRPSAWRTIMAQNCPDTCPRLPYWSNPRVKYFGGIPMGTAGKNDNARVLNETAGSISSFRRPMNLAPIVGLLFGGGSVSLIPVYGLLFEPTGQ